MLRIENTSDGRTTTIHLIGHAQSEHLEEITNQIEGCGSKVALDLQEITVVDVHVVRFLGQCEKEGIELLHCPLYIREWISREQPQRRPSRVLPAKNRVRT